MKKQQKEILRGSGYEAPVSKVVELQSEGVLCSSDPTAPINQWYQEGYDEDLVL